MNTKEKHEEKLLSCIDIPYFRNNPAYIDLWRSYYSQFRDPQILFLMYYKQISIYFHWIHIELSQYFLRKKQPQIAHFILEEALRNKVYDQERIKEALSQIPRFERKYNRGDMLSVLNIKNIKCLGRIWNSYIEEIFSQKNLPVEFSTFEEMKIEEYEKNFVNPEISKSFIASAVSLYTKIEPKNHEDKMKCENTNEFFVSSSNTENNKNNIKDATEKDTDVMDSSSILHNVNDDAGIYIPNQKQFSDSRIDKAEPELSNDQREIKNDENYDDISISVDYKELECAGSHISIKEQVDSSNLKEPHQDNLFNSENILSLKSDVSISITIEDQANVNNSLMNENTCSENEQVDFILQNKENSNLLSELNSLGSPKKIKSNDLHCTEAFIPNSFEIQGTLEMGSELLINGYVYFVHSIEKNGFSLLKIAKADDVTQTILGKSSMLIETDVDSLSIAKNVFDFDLCNHNNHFYLLFDFVSLCSLESILSSLNSNVKAFYLNQIIEKLLPLNDNFKIVSEPLNFFIDQNFNLGFGSFNLKPNTDSNSIDLLKASFSEFDVSISYEFKLSLQKILNLPEVKKDILRHKTELLENL